jgi:acetyltransferase-like isoleucine patch superfamily enzyme
MTSLLEFARENGWPEAMARALGSGQRRTRDAMTGRKLGAAGFRVGRHPRLLGLGHMRIGANFKAGDDLWLEAVVQYRGERFTPELRIGDNVNVSDRVHVACLRLVEIGAGTLLGSGVFVSDHGHGVYRGEAQSSPETMPAQRWLSSNAPVRLGRNVWVGDGVTILAGADIGDGAIVGAGSVVNGVVPAATVVVGSPARAVRRWDEAAREWRRL